MRQTKTANDSAVPKEVLFDFVFGKSNEGILLTQIDGTIEKANPAVSVLLGYSLSEMESRNVCDLIHVTDRHKRQDEVDNLIAGKIDRVRATRRFVTNGGSTALLTIRTYPIHKNGQIVRLITFLWASEVDPQAISQSLDARVKQLEELLQQYGKPEEWRTVNHIHVGDDVGGDKSGRDKTVNSTKIFYFIAVVLAGIASLLAYIGYLITFPSHGGKAEPPHQHEIRHNE